MCFFLCVCVLENILHLLSRGGLTQSGTTISCTLQVSKNILVQSSIHSSEECAFKIFLSIAQNKSIHFFHIFTIHYSTSSNRPSVLDTTENSTFHIIFTHIPMTVVCTTRWRSFGGSWWWIANLLHRIEKELLNSAVQTKQSRYVSLIFFSSLFYTEAW